MANVSTWSTTAASNNSASPDGFPENMAPSGVNNSGREVMAAVRRQHEGAEWINLGLTPTFVDTDTFTVVGDYTTEYHTGRRLKIDDASTLYGIIVSSSYSAPDTTVNVTLDSGNLSASISAVSHGVISAVNSSVAPATAGGGVLAGKNTIDSASLIDNGAITAAKLDSALGTWVLVEENTPTSGTTVEFTTGLGTYTRYRLVLRNVGPASGTEMALNLTVSTDGGSTYESADYKRAYTGFDSGGTDQTSTDNSGAFIALTPVNADTSTGGRIDMEIETANLSNSAIYKTLHFKAGYVIATAKLVGYYGTAMWAGGTAAIDGLKVTASTGTFGSGTVSLYGLLNE